MEKTYGSSQLIFFLLLGWEKNDRDFGVDSRKSLYTKKYDLKASLISLTKTGQVRRWHFLINSGWKTYWDVMLFGVWKIGRRSNPSSQKKTLGQVILFPSAIVQSLRDTLNRPNMHSVFFTCTTHWHSPQTNYSEGRILSKYHHHPSIDVSPSFLYLLQTL